MRGMYAKLPVQGNSIRIEEQKSRRQEGKQFTDNSLTS